MENKNSYRGPFYFGDLNGIPPKHDLIAFVRNNAYATCSCGGEHVLTDRAYQCVREGFQIHQFEYVDLIGKICLSDDVNNILKKIGGLFH